MARILGRGLFFRELLHGASELLQPWSWAPAFWLRSVQGDTFPWWPRLSHRRARKRPWELPCPVYSSGAHSLHSQYQTLL